LQSLAGAEKMIKELTPDILEDDDVEQVRQSPIRNSTLDR
jgi:hypothetical protein